MLSSQDWLGLGLANGLEYASLYCIGQVTCRCERDQVSSRLQGQESSMGWERYGERLRVHSSSALHILHGLSFDNHVIWRPLATRPSFLALRSNPAYQPQSIPSVDVSQADASS